MCNEKILPLRRGVGFVKRAVNSFKFIIVDAMELWAQAVGVRVANQANRAGMKGRNSNILTAARARLPPWKFLSILQARIKNINRTTPGMGIGQRTNILFASRPKFGRRQLGGHGRSVVVQMHSMGHGQRPQGAIAFIEPSKSSVERLHYRSSNNY